MYMYILDLIIMYRNTNNVSEIFINQSFKVNLL